MILPARTVAPTACPSTSFREVRQNAQPTYGRLRGALVMTPAQPPRAPSTRALGMSYCLTEVFVNLYAASPWFRRRLSGFSGLALSGPPGPAQASHGAAGVKKQQKMRGQPLSGLPPHGRFRP